MASTLAARLIQLARRAPASAVETAADLAAQVETLAEAPHEKPDAEVVAPAGADTVQGATGDDTVAGGTEAPTAAAPTVDADAVASAVSGERARMLGIFRAEGADANPALAMHFVESGADVATAEAALKAAASSTPNARGASLDALMAGQAQPSLGDDGPAKPDATNDPKSVAATILAAYQRTR